MENDERKISNTTFGLMIVVAVFVDLIQLLLNLIPVIGWIIIWGVNILAWMTFYVWFKTKGVSLSKPTRILGFLGSFFIELIPIINVLPASTLMVVLTVSSSRAEELAAKKGLLASVAKVATAGSKGVNRASGGGQEQTR